MRICVKENSLKPSLRALDKTESIVSADREISKDGPIELTQPISADCAATGGLGSS